MDSKLITIIGITGTQGSSVANHFLKHANWRIRGTTRNTSSAKAQAWTAQGVEIVAADINDTASLRTAFLGSHAIFAVTDYAAAHSSVVANNHQPSDESIASQAATLELTQGINIATAASDSEVLATLEKFVFSTLTPIGKASGGKYLDASETDSKFAVETHIRTQVPRLASRLSTVNMSMYVENWRGVPAMAPHRETDGSYSFLNLVWPGSYQAMPMVVASRDTGAFVSALVLHCPSGTDVIGVSEFVSTSDYARLWGRVMDVKVNVNDVGLEEWAAQVPDEITAPMKDMFRFLIEFGYSGSDDSVKLPSDLGIQTTSMETYIGEEDWSSVTQ